MANVQTAASSRGVDYDPLRLLWRVLTSVRFALALIGFLALLSLLGVVLPQLPAPMRGNPAAVDAWLALQETRFGFLTGPLYRLQLFEIFRSGWFVGGLATLVASVCVCTANRLPPVWRNFAHPQTRVPDDYFEHAGATLTTAAVEPAALQEALQRRFYRVQLTREDDATYVFADRFPWAQLATFVSHLALILFLAGGFVTLLTAREWQMFVAEGAPGGAPVFAPNDPDHMQVYVEDAVGRFDEAGFPLDYRSSLVVYQGGREVARGVSTVNSPLRYDGFKFHQSAYFPDGAALEVRDVASGRLVYNEVLGLTGTASTPRIVVRDAAGSVLLDDVIVPTDFLGEVAGTLVSVPGSGRAFWIGARPAGEGSAWQLVVFETADVGARAVLTEGERRVFDDLSISFVGMTGVPSVAVTGLPGASGEAVAELTRGENHLLTIGPVGGSALALSPGEPVVHGDYEYTCSGGGEVAGFSVRRDPGGTFIWTATGLLLLGLVLTFYTPRRRLWGKITANSAAFRGLGGRSLAIEREIREVTARASTRDAARE